MPNLEREGCLRNKKEVDADSPPVVAGHPVGDPAGSLMQAPPFLRRDPPLCGGRTPPAQSDLGDQDKIALTRDHIDLQRSDADIPANDLVAR